jgi:hypothetical protein
MIEIRKGLQKFVLIPIGKWPVGRLRSKWEDNIKMHGRGIGCNDGTSSELCPSVDFEPSEC